ncbi:nuclear envelope integral membrane protein [Parasteatoda tepidariorum]|uniref:nuclear envelope integral membrane protein n=1 Tax=Parasteatoda tepidariorum TaxID=114398 RepID=UPI0039BC824D
MAVIFRSLVIFYATLTLSYSTSLDVPMVQLLPNEIVNKNNDTELVVYCFDNVPKSFLQIWRSVQLLLEKAPTSYEIFTGEDPSVVLKKSNEKSMWSPSSWFYSQKTTVEFPAFSPYCVGFSSRENYDLFLKVRVVNYWKVIQMIVGIVLFFSAPSLSRNPFFHYTSGVSVGVVASLLIIIYIVGRFIPGRSTYAYAVMVFGYSFILYLLQNVWQHFNDIVSNYMDILLIYCLCAALISFIVCYRLGPVENVRTFKIIQGCMQLIALVLIYLGSEYREVSTAIIIILGSIYLIPARWISRLQTIWLRLFPPKIKLLTEVEYIEQGSIETAKALDELRRFCSSPDCNTWKMVRQLKDPIRFSKFVDTGCHYTDEELLRYNSEDFDEEEEEQEAANFARNGSVTSSQYNLSFR